MQNAKDEQLDLDDTLQCFTNGFEALLAKVEDLTRKNVKLERQIKALQAKDRLGSSLESHDECVAAGLLPKVLEDSKSERYSSYSSPPTDPATCDDRLIRCYPSELELDESVKAGTAAWRSLRMAGNNMTLKFTQMPNLLPLPTSERHQQVNQKNATPNPSSVEQDFTTHGKQGDLKCPFASMKRRRPPGVSPASSDQIYQMRPGALPTPPGLKGSPTCDPIAAEFHVTDATSPPPSVAGSASKCPIRFLDQHSPEEVAKYFENHKHEIPRSHEVCVKRYQSNKEGIRQLDAKYGNLVSMIQGLGVKHQPMLTTREEEQKSSVMIGRDSMDNVARWATTCSANLDDAEELAQDDHNESRSSKFDRPFKEIRVGESPSRPWGIQVPYTKGLAMSNHSEGGIDAGRGLSASQSQVDGKQPLQAFPLPKPLPSTCAFVHSKEQSGTHAYSEKQGPQIHDGPATRPLQKQSSPTEERTSKVKVDPISRQQQPRMVFTGPVFIGYPAEQAASLLQSYQRS